MQLKAKQEVSMPFDQTWRSHKRVLKWQPVQKKPSVTKSELRWKWSLNLASTVPLEVWLICSCSLATHPTDLLLS